MSKTCTHSVSSLIIFALVFGFAFSIQTNDAYAIESSPENSYSLCHDGLDNDNDERTDMIDPDCASFELPPAPAPNAGPSYSSGTTPWEGPDAVRARSARIAMGSSSPNNSCQPVITQYLKKGQNNPVHEVQTLQFFLNTWLGLNIPVTGIFDDQTEAAVKILQLKHADVILQPWVNIGAMSKPTPSGYVYKTTKWFINNTVCGGGIPMPLLP